MENATPADVPETPQPVTPPPAAVPPPLIQPPRPTTARRRSSWGAWVVVVLAVGGLLVLVLGGYLLQQFTHALNGMSLQQARLGPSAKQLLEVVVKDNDAREKIVIVDLLGIISGDDSDRGSHNLVTFVKDQLQLAGEDHRVHAVILNVDSPGGEVLASDEISRAIAEFQQKHRKPVVASMQSLAASGGYYVAAPCRWIVAHDMTITGSIGVIMRGYNYRGLMDKVGVRPQVYKSGRFKDMMSGDKLEEDISPEERRMLQALIDETYTRFKKVVKEGRTASNAANQPEGRTLVSDWETYADGRIFSGTLAHEYGFVDELGGFDTAVERTLKLAGIQEANLVRYRRPFVFGGLFDLFGQTEGRAVKLDLGLDLPRIHAGRLYFICPTVLN